MVAFSGAAIAKTGEVKEVELKFVNDPCSDVCHLAYDLARKEGADHKTADEYADRVYGNCIASRKLLSQEAAISQ
jgi:hypothetical protein